MGRVPLLGGAYEARSVIADAQRCVNLFPEQNPKDAEVPVTHYQTPGLTLLGTPPFIGPGRGLYRATNDELFAVVGSGVYFINSAFAYTQLGVIGAGQNPVSFSDNGIDILLVDGSLNGYIINLANHAMSSVVDPDFVGGDRVDYIDTFFVLNQPGTRNFYCSNSNSASAYTGTNLAAKSGSPDKIASIVVIHREIWLIGDQYGTEIWYNAGAAAFPFQIVPGAFIQYGCAAKYTVTYNGLEIFWLGRDKNGTAFVLKGTPYKAEVVSNPAIQKEFATYSTISDAVAFIYQQDSHIFYVITFPTVNKTWAYDTTTGAWHERCFLDINGTENRIRPICHAYAYGKNCVLDWQNGQLYEYDIGNHTDNGVPIIRRRGFPHMVGDEGQRVIYKSFTADIEVGTVTGVQSITWSDFSSDFNADFGPGSASEDLNSPWVSLRWSDTRGKSWGNPIRQSLGASGEYLTQPQWNRLGMARDRVFEVYWTGNFECALNGAFVDAGPSRT